MKKVTKFGVVLTLASAGLLGFLNRWEGDDTTVYADKLAGNLPTACGGVTKHTSPYPVIVGDVWSRSRCDEVITMVTEKTQLKLLDCFKVRINQGQLDAFSSHAHNFGVANTCASYAMGLTNAGRPLDGCEALSRTPSGEPNWSFVTVLVNGVEQKKFVKGLHSRRLAETEMCKRGFT